MSDVTLVLAMAAITYGSRAVFLVRPGNAPGGWLGGFLRRFPLALFLSLAAATILVPDSSVPPDLGYAAFGGAVAGAVAFRRSLPGVLIAGGGVYWAARLIVG